MPELCPGCVMQSVEEHSGVPRSSRSRKPGSANARDAPTPRRTGGALGGRLGVGRGGEEESEGWRAEINSRARARAVTPQCFPSELVTFGPRTSGVGVHVRGANLRVWNVLGKGAPELER